METVSDPCGYCGHAKEAHPFGGCDYCALDKTITAPCDDYEAPNV
jgi:hypothetical protein